MNGGSANGKPVSKSKNPGLAKMAKTPKGKGLRKLPKDVRNKMGFMKKGGRVKKKKK